MRGERVVPDRSARVTREGTNRADHASVRDEDPTRGDTVLRCHPNADPALPLRVGQGQRLRPSPPPPCHERQQAYTPRTESAEDVRGRSKRPPRLASRALDARRRHGASGHHGTSSGRLGTSAWKSSLSARWASHLHVDPRMGRHFGRERLGKEPLLAAAITMVHVTHRRLDVRVTYPRLHRRHLRPPHRERAECVP